MTLYSPETKTPVKYSLPVSIGYLDDKMCFAVIPPTTKSNELFWRYIPDIFSKVGTTNNLQATFFGDVALLSAFIKESPDEEVITFWKPTVGDKLSKAFNYPKNYNIRHQEIDEQNGITKQILTSIFNKIFLSKNDPEPSPLVNKQQFEFIKNFYDIISSDVMDIDTELTKDFLDSLKVRRHTTEFIQMMKTHQKEVDPRFLIMLNAVVLAGAKTFNAL